MESNGAEKSKILCELQSSVAVHGVDLPGAEILGTLVDPQHSYRGDHFNNCF